MEKKYVASWSGGKDSTFMIDILIKEKKPIDEIILCDTGYEHKQLYDYIYKIKEYWEKLGYKVTILNENKGKDIWHEKMFGKFVRGKKKGQIRGFPPVFSIGYCTDYLKVKPFKIYIKENYKNFDVYTYIGLAYNELKRMSKNKKEIYPLIEKQIDENYIKKWILDKNNFYYNPLYKDFDRLGCFICPKQSLDSLKTIYEKYPEEWKKIVNLEKKLTELNSPHSKFKRKGTKEIEQKILKNNKAKFNLNEW